MLSTWDSTFCIIQLLKSQDHHLSLTTIDGLSSWVAASQVGEIRYAVYEKMVVKFIFLKFQKPPTSCYLFPHVIYIPRDKNGSCRKFIEKFQPLPPAQQLYAVLHHALAEGLRCDPGIHWEHPWIPVGARNKVMCGIHVGAEWVSP